MTLPSLPPGYSWEADVFNDVVHLRLVGASHTSEFVKTERELRKHASRMADLAWLADAVPTEEQMP